MANVRLGEAEFKQKRHLGVYVTPSALARDPSTRPIDSVFSSCDHELLAEQVEPATARIGSSGA